MRVFILALFIAFPIFARTTFRIRELPEISYIRKEVNLYTRTSEEIRKAQLVTHDVVEEIVKEVRRLKVKFPDERFFQIDMKENKVLFVCQEIFEPKKIPKHLIFRRPAGKYLSIEYEGHPEEATFGKDIGPFLEKHHLKVLSWEAFQYKPSAVPLTRPKEFLLPVGP